jgi:hypothetical protein
MFRRTLLIAAMAIMPAGLVITAAGGAAAAASPDSASAACSGVIKITGLAFHPPEVPPGKLASAILDAVNCTGKSQQTTAVWTGRFAGPGKAIPPGCPVIDPLALPVDFAPHAAVATGVGYEVLPSCTATKLTVTVKIEKNGKVLAGKTATLKIVRPVAAAG